MISSNYFQITKYKFDVRRELFIFNAKFTKVKGKLVASNQQTKNFFGAASKINFIAIDSSVEVCK
jgi:hypothetical protein